MGSDDGKELREGVSRKNLAVFVSGGGSNFRSIYEAILDGKINGDIVVLVASKPGMFLIVLIFLLNSFRCFCVLLV